MEEISFHALGEAYAGVFATGTALTLPEAALQVAIEEMNAGAGEEGANNSGPWIIKYLHGLAEPPSNWCAGFVSFCYFEASNRLNVQMPFNYSISAKGIYNQFKAANYLVANPQEADIIFFWRENISSWMGHIGLVHHVENNTKLITIEGNRGSFPAKVCSWSYQLPPPQLLGYGRVV